MVAVLAAAFVGAAFFIPGGLLSDAAQSGNGVPHRGVGSGELFPHVGIFRLADRLCDKERGIVSRFVGRTMQDGENGMEK